MAPRSAVGEGQRPERLALDAERDDHPRAGVHPTQHRQVLRTFGVRLEPPLRDFRHEHRVARSDHFGKGVRGIPWDGKPLVNLADDLHVRRLHVRDRLRFDRRTFEVHRAPIGKARNHEAEEARDRRTGIQ